MREKRVDTLKLQLKELPAWAPPHRFAVLPLEDNPHPPADVFTYGPLITDVAIALGHLSKRSGWIPVNAGIGLEWMNSLTSAGDTPLPPEEPATWLGEVIETTAQADVAPVSDLEVFLHRNYGLQQPGHAHNWNIFEDACGDPPRVPTDVLDAFAAKEAPLTQPLFDRLDPYISEVVAAARGRRRVSAVDIDGLLHEIAEAAIPFRPQVFHGRDGEPIGIGPTTRRLHHRVLLELLDVFMRRPVLARCDACSRLFVPPRNSARYCRRYVWDAHTFELLRGCVADQAATEILAKIDPDKYRTEYERLSRAYSRAKTKLGADHPKTLERERERDAWRTKVKRPRGRPQNPFPPESTVPDKKGSDLV